MTRMRLGPGPQTSTTSDGATISATTRGVGPHLLLVPCVSTSRTTDPQQSLPDALAEHFTVTTYDRRGTGESTMPPGSTIEDYAVEQEIADITMLAECAGAPVDVYGFSPPVPSWLSSLRRRGRRSGGWSCWSRRSSSPAPTRTIGRGCAS